MSSPFRRLRAVLAAALLCTSFAVAALEAGAPDGINTMSSEQIVAEAERLHPSALYVLAGRLFQEDGRQDEAVEWFYIGQLRYRVHLAANPGEPSDADPVLFAALSESVGRPLNEYAGGDVDEWVASIDRALAWDEAHDNQFTSKTEHAAEYAEVREGLVKLRDNLVERKDEIRKTREQNGLPNRS